MNIQSLKKVIAKIEKHKKTIAEHRDKLMIIYDELADCLMAFDTGLEELEEGVRNLGNGIDSISKVV